MQKHLHCLFLGWFAHRSIADNPLASLRSLRRLQPQHIFIKRTLVLFDDLIEIFGFCYQFYILIYFETI